MIPIFALRKWLAYEPCANTHQQNLMNMAYNIGAKINKSGNVFKPQKGVECARIKERNDFSVCVRDQLKKQTFARHMKSPAYLAILLRDVLRTSAPSLRQYCSQLRWNVALSCLQFGNTTLSKTRRNCLVCEDCT